MIGCAAKNDMVTDHCLIELQCLHDQWYILKTCSSGMILPQRGSGWVRGGTPIVKG